MKKTIILLIFSDIDECRVEIASCHPSAECQNLNGAYKCKCPANGQFIGDGRDCFEIKDVNDDEKAEGGQFFYLYTSIAFKKVDRDI